MLASSAFVITQTNDEFKSSSYDFEINSGKLLIILMNLQRLDLNLLRIFVAVHTHGSVTAAANAMHLSQPAVSNALARLRKELGDELFTRQGMGLQPTAFAIRLAPKIRSALVALTDALTEEPAFDPASAKRIFRLAMTDAGHQVFLPQLAQALRSAPEVQLHSFPLAFDGSIAYALGEGQIDLVIGPLPEEALLNLEVWPLFIERYVAVLPQRLLGAEKANGRQLRKITMEQLRRSPILVVEQESTRHRLVPQALEALGLKGLVHYRVPYFSAAAPMILACDAIAIVPSEIGQRFARESRGSQAIETCELPFHLDSYPVSLARHPRFARDSGINWLANLARQVLGKDAAQ
jgi:DNA-binding transcriptional LysR family regulator